MYIINSKGEKEVFSKQKLLSSIKKVSSSNKLAKEVFNSVRKEIKSKTKTLDIAKKVKKEFSKKDKVAAAKFNLKDGMRKLGPTGFLFEKYTAEVLKKLGFKVKINQYLPGKCLNKYEIDFVARRKGLIYIGECKYRNLYGDRVHQNEALSSHARFLDIINGPYFKGKKYKSYEIKSMLATNTKFTRNAYNYSNCVGVDLLGWKVPKGAGLESLISEYNLYPVTLLNSFKGHLKDVLVSEKKMLISDVAKINPEKFAKKHKISVKSVVSLVKEAQFFFAK